MCSKMVCSKCLNSSEGSIQILGKRFCKKCFKLRSGNFTRKDLDLYSVRELRNFLLGKNISLQGCREKNDLTELTLRCSVCESSVDQSSLEHSRHIELLRVSIVTDLCICNLLNFGVVCFYNFKKLAYICIELLMRISEFIMNFTVKLL